MIERIPNTRTLTPIHKDQHIWFISYQSIYLKDKLEELYRSVKQQDRKLYNVRIYKEDAERGGDEDKGKAKETGDLVKNKLDMKVKHYITWCFLVLNWQYLSTENLSAYLSSLPTSQHEPEQILIEPNTLKLTKHNKALTLNLLTHELSLTDNRYFLDSYNRKGNTPLLEYKPSLCQIEINSIIYRFDGLIRLVEGCEGFVAVATDTAVYVIGVREGMGVARFGVEGCVDVKWGKRGLYYLLRSGHLGLLQRQTTFIPTSNQFSQPTTLSLPLPKDHLPHRLAILPHKETILLLSSARSNPKKILLQLINSQQYGMHNNYSHSFEMKEINGEVVYRNLVDFGDGTVGVVGVVGRDGRVQEYCQYRFGTG